MTGQAIKICDITEFSHAISGGGKTYLRQKADYLTARRKWEHILIIPGAVDGEASDSRRRIYTVKSPTIPGHRPYHFLLNRSRVRAILTSEAPDLVEMGSPFLVPWVLLLAIRHPRPLLTGFYHADFPTAYLRRYGRKLGTHVGRVAEAAAWAYTRTVYSRCDLVLAASKHTAEKLRAHGIGPVRRVPLGVDSVRFRPDRRSDALQAQMGARRGQKLILYVGRLSSVKGVSMMLKGFDRLPSEHYRLIVVGDGPERPGLEGFAASHANVTFAGYCSDRDRLADIYASCDVFLAPGHYETFGLTVLEAFASGLPVLGTRGDPVVELIEPGTGVLTAPDDPAEMAARIEEMCVGDLRSMGMRARRLVECRYSWDKTFDAIADIYEELVDARGNTGR